MPVDDDVPKRRATPEWSPGRETVCKGETIGRYVVHRQLGRGGMGIVYGAVDPELGRRVAIKLVRTKAKRGPQYTTRLRREAEALARLDHPNIVSIYDIGANRRGTFVAMEYVRGMSIRKWLRQGKRSWRDIVEVFAAAGRGLAAAHAAGLVHRDFKPSNVMVTLDGRVKVLDFGLARGTPTDDPWLNTQACLLSRRMTRADTIVGTTGYMPPEQLLGSEVGPLSDQFSFSVALFEALHGDKPYVGKDAIDQARAYTEGRRNPVEPRRDLPGKLRRTIERGMSLRLEERYPNMDALLHDLTWEPPQRKRTALVLIALVCTACVSASAATWAARQPGPEVAAVCGDAQP